MSFQREQLYAWCAIKHFCCPRTTPATKRGYGMFLYLQIGVHRPKCPLAETRGIRRMKLKYALLTSALALTFASNALAADMRAPARAPAYRAPPPVPYAASWTGCYIGVSGGGAWGRAHSISNGTANGFPTGTAGVLKTDTDL